MFEQSQSSKRVENDTTAAVPRKVGRPPKDKSLINLKKQA